MLQIYFLQQWEMRAGIGKDHDRRGNHRRYRECRGALRLARRHPPREDDPIGVACSLLIQLTRFVAEAGRIPKELARDAEEHPTNQTAEDRAHRDPPCEVILPMVTQ
jgi:hypothetical protein